MRQKLTALSNNWDMADTINSLIDGVVGTLTLTANTTTTTVSDSTVSLASVITMTPKTANAAGELATMYISAVADNSFIIIHSNQTSTDRTFDYTVTR